MASNEEDVGQIRSNSGTSMKRMMKDDALQASVSNPIGDLTGLSSPKCEEVTYSARAQNIMIRGLKVKIFEIPSAKHRIMERIPSLER